MGLMERFITAEAEAPHDLPYSVTDNTDRDYF